MKVKSVVVGPLGNNTYLAISNEGNGALIDPGMNCSLIESMINEEGTQVKFILLTHGHFDHIASALELSKKLGAKIVINEPDAEMLSDAEKCLAFNFTRDFTPFNADIIVNDGDEITLDELTFKFVATPGHSKGSAVILCEDIMFAGDTVLEGTVGRTDLYGGSFSQMLASIKKLSQIEKDYKLLCGHDKPSTLFFEKKNNPYFIKFA